MHVNVLSYDPKQAEIINYRQLNMCKEGDAGLIL